ncbi:MAG: exodeoxyribonuclease VII large subunit [Immundisolibacteraceae bacterium]|nr:exodeoxyribonuclease VII large subunit [Immundisolibacteraceae bacterium]
MRPSKDIYSVSRLAFEARGAIEKKFPLLWIEGEISNLSRPASGHLYFTLKDSKSQVRCALFRNRRQQLGVEPENGTQVLVRARVTLYEGRSEFQLLIEQIEPAGEGVLLRQLERLKTKLQAEGLFAEQHKKTLPAYPSTIALITSPVGAAVHDLQTTLARRWPIAKIILLPCLVQGDQAARQLTAKIVEANKNDAVDLIILARGGGSVEDLAAFNDESLVRTIAASDLPLISGVGHESDWTLADMAADLRAATPTAAAELATPDKLELIQTINAHLNGLQTSQRRLLVNHQQQLDWQRQRLIHPGEKLQAVKLRLQQNWQALKRLEKQTISACQLRLNQAEAKLTQHSPARQLGQLEQRKNHSVNQLQRLITNLINQRKQTLGNSAAALTVLNPLATLARGYAIVRDEDSDEIINSGNQLKIGDSIQVQLVDANIQSRVEKIDLAKSS